MGATFLAILPMALPVKAEYLPEQRPGLCKNKVMYRYNTDISDVQITMKNITGEKIYWLVQSTGRTGHCIFDRSHNVIRLVVDNQEQNLPATGAIYWNSQSNQWIAPDGGVCHSCTPENGFPTPPQMMNEFFYLPNEKLWYDADGHLCSSCTPQNGFPIK
ncbi:hypothetical protein GM3709_1592 [Geminocystis sp. NIES-3709]|nr:hypothetical protein GM3709_1592 [Geminocystis sp. NIES-3709]